MLSHSYFITNIWFYVFVIAALEAQVVYTWQFRKMPGAMTAICAQTGKIIWLVSLVLVSMSADLKNKIFWITVQKIAANLLPFLWLVFTVQISQQSKRIPSIIKYCFGGITGALVLLLIFNGHGLFWQDAWLEGQNLILISGPGQLVGLAYAYLVGTITTVLAVRWIGVSGGLRRKQALWYFGAVLITWASHIMWAISGGKVESIPWGFLFNGIIVVWIFFRWQFYNVLPLAQAVASRHVIEGLIIVDYEDYIVDMNPAAKNMFCGLPVAVGVKFQHAASAWPALAEADSTLEIVEAELEQPGGRRYYHLRRIPLQSSSSQLLGRVILLKDITKQKQDQDQIIDQQKALSILTERERLGRELHDGRAQVWNYFQMELQAVRLLLNRNEAANAQKQMERLFRKIKELNDDDRESIVGLKKADSARYDFVSSLQEYLAWYEKDRGIRAQLILPAEPISSLLSSTGEVQLMRIIQEALTNVRKHAKAKQVKVVIESDSGQVTVLIEDDGCGFDPAATAASKKKFGLHIMAERAKEAGGHLWIQSASGHGTRVIVHLGLKTQETG